MSSTLTNTGITFNDGTSQNSAAGGALIPKISKTFSNSASHTLSSNTKYVQFKAVGGGGNSQGGGGGGGGYASAVIDKSNVFPNTNVIAVNIGAAGGATSVGGYVVGNGGGNGGSYNNGTNGGARGNAAVNVTSLYSQIGSGGNGNGAPYNGSVNARTGGSPATVGGGGGASFGNYPNPTYALPGIGVVPIPGATTNTGQGGNAGANGAQGGVFTFGSKGMAQIIEYTE